MLDVKKYVEKKKSCEPPIEHIENSTPSLWGIPWNCQGCGAREGHERNPGASEGGNPWLEPKPCKFHSELCVSTSLCNFSSWSSRFIASGRRSNGVKLWYCLTKQPVCESQGEVLAFMLAPGMQGNPRKSHLFPIKTMLLSLQPRFWKRDDCPRVILGTYPDYSSRIAVLTQSCLLLKWNSPADSEQLSQTEKSIYWNNTGEFWSLPHLEHSGGCSSIVRSAFAEAVLWTSWSHVPIPLAHWLWSGVSQHLHSVHSSVLFPAFHAGPDQITVGLLLISWLVPLTSS